MLPRQHRLTSKKDFQEVFLKGKNISGRFFNIVILHSDSGKKSKFGIIVSNKVSKRAVLRNRIKRVVRSFIQDHILELENGINILVVARNNSSFQENTVLAEDLKSCFDRL
ncbi:MAG: ribonuclease P protein component [Candidatus Blackburnbacteria bacterium]|nr:ribonuclease P protein component [Candidatus Blackburnbacteria bacterium]